MRYEDMSPEQQAEIDAYRVYVAPIIAQREAAEAARQATRDARLADIPASVNSVPALRDIVQGIVEELRGD